MKKNIIFIMAIITALALLALIFFIRTNKLGNDLNESALLVKKMQEEIQILEKEKAKEKDENEKLKADAVSYLSINNELQGQKEAAENKLKTASSLIKKKELELAGYRSKLDQFNKTLAESKKKIGAGFAKEKAELQKKADALEMALKKERGIYHYNLAVAYTQAKLYDDAIMEYNKALENTPDNAEAHYNLGLIYSKARFNQEKAILHYSAYLKMKPDANDIEEVRTIIYNLGRQ